MKYFLMYGGACLLGEACWSIIGAIAIVGIVAVVHGGVLAVWEAES